MRLHVYGADGLGECYDAQQYFLMTGLCWLRSDGRWQYVQRRIRESLVFILGSRQYFEYKVPFHLVKAYIGYQEHDSSHPKRPIGATPAEHPFSTSELDPSSHRSPPSSSHSFPLPFLSPASSSTSSPSS